MTSGAKKIAIAILSPILVASFLALAKTSADAFGVLSTSGFMPHRMCLSGAQWVIWGDVVVNETIAICYFIIPSLLLKVFSVGIVIQPSDKEKMRHAKVLLPWFAAFILSCGLTHQMDVVTLWFPFYYMDLLVRSVTAVASVGTCITLSQQLPVLMGAVSTADLLEQINKLSAQVEGLALAARAISEAKGQ